MSDQVIYKMATAIASVNALLATPGRLSQLLAIIKGFRNGAV